MRGSSRGAAATVQEAFDAALSGGVDRSGLAEDLFAITSVVDCNASLRRALADPSGEPAAKRALAERLFGGKVGDGAIGLVALAAEQRWADERDFSDTLESTAVSSLLARAEAEGRIDDVEDQLFRFERIVAGDTALRDTLSSRNTDGEGKAGVVATLLEGKAHPETVRLAQQAVRVPRGRRLDRVLAAYLDLAAKRRDELTALVTVASALTEQQAARLRTQLETMYGKSVSLQTVVDPHVLGGIRVQVGDEVMDGTISARIDQARRHVTGN
ncbi:MAG: F0F1 ATP synthase subunit delta [Actinobacteria bacterium]|nr:F0F1 ATP synthase subunit delta [Actinomycetota bacterium]